MGHLYRVSFFKKLTDSTGHPFDVSQGIVEVRGDTLRILTEAVQAL
jgi:hypothetical protein